MIALPRLSVVFYGCLLKAEIGVAFTPGVIPPNWNAASWYANDYTYTYREMTCPFPVIRSSCFTIFEAPEWDSIPYAANPINYSYVPIYGEYFTQIIDLVNAPYASSQPQFSFLTISVLPTKSGSNSKELFAPMFLKTALVIWRDGGSVWDVPSGSRHEMNSLFVDMCPDLTACKRPDAMRRVHRASKGNWTKGQSWAPYRAAIIGRGATAETDDFAFHATVLLIENTMMTAGFKSNKITFFSSKARSTSLFARVDDHKFLSLLAIMLFYRSVSVPSAVWWICGNADGQELPIALDSFTKDLSNNFAFGVTYLMFLQTAADTYKPEVSTLTTYEAQIRGVWQLKQKFHIGAFVGHDSLTCPAFDFLSFAFSWIIGKGFFWISIGLDGANGLVSQYHSTYISQAKSQNSPYVYSYPFDGMYGITKHDLGPKWTDYKNWFKSKAWPSSSSMFDAWLAPSVLNPSQIDGLALEVEVEVASMLDAAWATMLVGNDCITSFGTNYTVKNQWEKMNLRNAPPPVFFEGLTGNLTMFITERVRDWIVTMYKRPLAKCSQEKARCIFSDLNSGNITLVLGCLTRNPDLSNDFVAADLSTQFTLWYETITKTVSQFFGCHSTTVPAGGTHLVHQLANSCGAGQYYDAGKAKCYSCGPGYYSIGGDEVVCLQCTVGKYQNDFTQTACKGCEEGKFIATVQATACVECAKGTFVASKGKNACDECFPGRYADVEGLEACKLCKAGTYSTNSKQTECTGCPDTFGTRSAGETSLGGCHCAAGDFLVANRCERCESAFPEGSYVCDAFNSVPYVKKEYMTLVGKTVMYYCPNFDEACPGGKQIGEDTCVRGASGVACGWCGEGREWKAKTGLCEDCSDIAKAIGAVFVCLGVCALFIKMRPLTATYTDNTVVKNVSIAFVTVPISHLVDFLQMQAIWSRSGVPWPKSNNNMFDGVAGLFSADTFSVPCLVGRGDEQGDALGVVVFLNMLPACLIAVCFLLALPSMVSKKAREMRMPHYIGASNTTLTVLVTFFVTILNFSIQRVFSVYEHPKAGQTSLVASPYILTEADQYSSMEVVAFIALGVWCGGSLVLITACVYSFSFVGNITFHRCTLALTIKYRSPCSWFILVEMLTKFMASMSVAFYEKAAKRMQFLVGVYTVYLAILTTHLPYRFPRHTVSDISFTCAKLAVQLMTAGFMHGENDDGLPVLCVVLIACVLFLFLFLSSLYLFLMGVAADPQRDFDTWYACAMFLGKHVIPMQNPFSDLAEDASPDQYPWKRSGANAKNALIVAAEQRQVQLEEALAKKDEHHRMDAQIIAGFVPQKHSATFAKLTDSQRDVAKLFEAQGKSSSETKKYMEEQQGLIRQLFD